MLSVFPLDVLDEIWDLIESVSEGFLTYSPIQAQNISVYLLFSLNQNKPELEIKKTSMFTLFLVRTTIQLRNQSGLPNTRTKPFMLT